MDNMNPIGYGLKFPHFHPLNFRDYRNYLPTAYDDSLSMQESLLQVLNFCNEIGLLNQNMSDNWNMLLGWIKTNGIDDAVSAQLNAWVADGTMAQVLNKTALKDINKKLDDLLTDYPKQLQATKDFVNNTVNSFKNDVNNTLNGQNIKIQQNYDSLMQQLSSISTGVKGVYSNLAALTSAKPTGDTGIYVTTDTGHWFFWNGTIWQDGGQFQAAKVGQDQIDLIKQQTLDFDNGIINSSAINSALGNQPYSAIGNVRLEIEKNVGARVVNNDVTATKKGVSINVVSTFNTYWLDETLEMRVRNDDGSPHTFVIDYVGVKNDGTQLALRSPLTKFNIPSEKQVNVITTVPAVSSLTKIARDDIDHLAIMVYTQSDASCQMLISKAKLYKQRNLPDINNEDKIDNDNLLAPNMASSTNLNSEKVFVEGLNKTCQRFYTNTGTGIWSLFSIPIRANISLTQHIQDEKLDRPLKGTITVKVTNDKSAISKYFPSLTFWDASGTAYKYDVPIKNSRLNGNTLKYAFTLPSIHSMAPNISFNSLRLDFTAYNVVNFDVTLIDASLKFTEATATITSRDNDDLGVNIMKALNDGENTFVSTSGAITCTIAKEQDRKVFKITKDASSNTGNLSIMLSNFNDTDLWCDKKLDLNVEKPSEGTLTIPMQLTLHESDGTTMVFPLNPLFVAAQKHHSQIISRLSSKTTAKPDYATLDFTINDTNEWIFFLKDISFKSSLDYGTQSMTYLPDKSAKLPQLRLFGDLTLIKSSNDKIIVPCSFVNHEEVINAYAQLKWQGKSTKMWPKKSYTVALFSDPNATVKLDFKPMPNFYSSNKFTAKADYIDRFHVRNGYGAWLFSQMIQTRKSLPSFFRSMNNFGEIQIMPINIVNNGYLGIYTLQTKKSNALYGMDKNNPNDIAIQGIENTDGAMWKKDTVTFDPEGDTGDFEVISDSDKQQNVQSAINRLAAFINSSTDDEFTANLNQYIDLDSLADLIISVQLTQNFDNTGGKNITYVTHDALKWYVQAYDMDATLGISWQPGSTQDDDVDSIKPASNKLISRFTNLFKDYIKNRFNELDESGVIAPFRMQEKFKEMTDSIGEYNFEQDNAAWPNDSYKGKDLSYILWLIVHRYYFTKQWISNL